MLEGKVVRAESSCFDSLETLARQRDAKGCFFERGAHLQVGEMEKWLEGLEEDEYEFGEIAVAQVQIAREKLEGACGDECDDPSCEDTARISIAGPEGICQACDELVEELPDSIQEHVRSDAESIAKMLARLCPNVPWLTLRLEIVQHNACIKWHQDAYTCRTLVTYVGPGTCTADDASVLWNVFEKTSDMETNDSCVPRDSIHQMEPNAILLMKGDAWPGIRGKGLTHKAPEISGDNPPKRLLLKVDLNNTRPPIGSYEEEDDVDYYDAPEREFRDISANTCRLLKRLASSEGFASSKTWKRMR